MREPKDLMLDLETMSTRPNAAILSIGAVVFDPYSSSFDDMGLFQLDPARTFYTNVDLVAQVERFGRHIDPGTIMWWMGQEKAARMALRENPQTLPVALFEYAAFCKRWGIERVWGYGATFDNVVIDDALKAVDMTNPVSYRGQRCMRTVAEMFPIERKPFTGTAHNALDDAINQVVQLQRIFNSFPRGRAEEVVHVAASV